MERTVTIVQPSYIPWRGYFDLVRRADVFIFYDDVQYDKHGWRNRNRIKTPNGLTWLTIPVLSKGTLARHASVKEVEIDERSDWRAKHLESVRHAYRRAPYFDETYEFLRNAYANRSRFLAEFTIDVTEKLARRMGIQSKFSRSSELPVTGHKMDRLMATLRAVDATHYISGPSARSYIEPSRFAEVGITLEYINYRYAPYPQLHGDYEPNVSVIDLLMMTGPRAPDYLVPLTPENDDIRNTSV
ncbi:MAG: WbqC family protein [Candidatus Eremiobacteraeota bacterium]|nr:WbqC family protein [Candidatus Eremiobacteraeota bacterium]